MIDKIDTSREDAYTVKWSAKDRQKAQALLQDRYSVMKRWQSAEISGHWIPLTAEKEVPTEFMPREAGVDPQLIDEQDGHDEDAGSACRGD
jgi:hypothetical protein